MEFIYYGVTLPDVGNELQPYRRHGTLVKATQLVLAALVLYYGRLVDDYSGDILRSNISRKNICRCYIQKLDYIQSYNIDNI
jgi:hypothetical protein